MLQGKLHVFCCPFFCTFSNIMWDDWHASWVSYLTLFFCYNQSWNQVQGLKGKNKITISSLNTPYQCTFCITYLRTWKFALPTLSKGLEVGKALGYSIKIVFFQGPANLWWSWSSRWWQCWNRWQQKSGCAFSSFSARGICISKNTGGILYWLMWH